VLSPDVADKWTEEPTRRPITLVKPGDPQADPDAASGDDEPPPDDESTDAMARVSQNLKRILAHDLTRLFKVETKAIRGYSRHPSEFVSKVDGFYAKQHSIIMDAVSESLSALTACGLSVDAEMFVATWITEGKSAVLEAAGACVATSLETAIESVIESNTWTERPIRAVERVSNAAAIM
jgi:hypothetical protein